MRDSGILLSEDTAWFLLILFSIIWVALGIFWGRRARDLEGFMVANRSVGLALGTATAVATWITSNTTMLAPQFALQLGIWGMLAYSTASIGLFLFAPLADRIQHLMPRGFTSADFIHRRYGPNAHAVFLVISFFYALTWMVSMGMAGGILLEALSGIDYVYGMTLILGVCVSYTLFGGLVAVIGTDFIQSAIILVGLIVVTGSLLTRVDTTQVYAHLAAHRPALLDVLFPAAIMSVFNNLLFGLGEIFHSNVWWSRVFAMRRGVGRRAYRLAGWLWLPVPIVAGFIGLAAPTLGVPIWRPDVVGPVVAAEVLGNVGAVVIFVVVFSSIASSVDSLLAATSDLFTKDVYQRWLHADASPEHVRRVASRVVVGTGVVTWLLCLPQVGTLATVLFFAGPLVGSTIWPIVAGLYWRNTHPAGATAAMVLGSVVGLAAYFGIGWYAGAMVGTGVSLAVVAISTLVRPTPFDWRRLAPQEEA